MGIFNSREKNRRQPSGSVTEADKAVLSLKTQRRKFSAERIRLESLIAKGILEAKKSIQAQRRERALLYLRKNKLYDNSISNIDAYLLNVEQILSNIEAAQRNNRLFSALKEGNSALQQLQKEVALEDIERLNEETLEAREYQDQLRELLGQSLSAQDDAEALEELERIQAEQEQAEAAMLAQVPARKTPTAEFESQPISQEELPAVPTHHVSLPSKQIEQQQPKKEALAI